MDRHGGASEPLPTGALRVLLFHNRAYPQVGGIETILTDMALGLARRGAAVWLVAPGAVRPPQAHGLAGLRILSPDLGETRTALRRFEEFQEPGVLLRELSATDLVAALRMILRDFLPQVVICHTPLNLLLAAMARTGLPGGRRMRLVLFLHGLAAPTDPYRAFEAQAMAAADGLWCSSRALAAEVQQRLGVAPAAIFNWRTAPYRLPEALLRGSDPAAAPLVVLPSRMAPVKGTDLGVRALRRLRTLRSGWRARLLGPVGSDPYRDHILDLIRSAELTPHVEVVPYMDAWHMGRVLSTAALTLLPSRSESYGLVAEESLVWGTPVVAFAVGGLREAVAARPHLARFAPAEDVEALARCMAEVLTGLPPQAPLACDQVAWAHEQLMARIMVGLRESF